MTKDDYVIICGDFGGVWSKYEESRQETMILDWFDCKSFTTLFVLGNHENFDRLSEYPVEKWYGGKVQRKGMETLSYQSSELGETGIALRRGNE